jgi:hypothetical protein
MGTQYIISYERLSVVLQVDVWYSVVIRVYELDIVMSSYCLSPSRRRTAQYECCKLFRSGHRLIWETTALLGMYIESFITYRTDGGTGILCRTGD